MSQPTSTAANIEAALYVVSTPIGNLGDITQRALEVLNQVDLIAAEDTRHSRQLMQHYGIETPLMAYHDHSDEAVLNKLLSLLDAGQSLALISDAGTPLIADPGYRLVKELRQRGVKVVPLPGASALLAALAVAGLATDRFAFEGFLPAKTEARRKYLAALQSEARTMVFYESPHRVLDTVQAMAETFGSERQVVMARELTKRFETIINSTLAELAHSIKQDPNQRRGEIVLVIAGLPQKKELASAEGELENMLAILLEELSVKQSAALASKLTGLKKNYVYQLALKMSQ